MSNRESKFEVNRSQGTKK